jgi:hypothetical protein
LGVRLNDKEKDDISAIPPFLNQPGAKKRRFMLKTEVKHLAEKNGWSYLIALNYLSAGRDRKEKEAALKMCRGDFERCDRQAVRAFIGL